MIEVVVGDGQGVFVEALTAALGQRQLQVRGVAHTAVDVMRAVRSCRPHVCLLDRAFRDGDGLVLIPDLLSLSPSTRIIVLAADHADASSRLAIELGAGGFVHKTRGIAVLVSAIRRVVEGNTVVELPPGRHADRDEETEQAHRLAAHLTSREQDCLRLLVQGAGTGDVADRLRVSTTTVRTHIQSVMTKLGVHSRLEAVAYAVRHDLVTPVASPGVRARRPGRGRLDHGTRIRPSPGPAAVPQIVGPPDAVHMDEERRASRREHGRVTLRVLLLDDQEMLVEALAVRLSAEPDLWVSCRGLAVDPLPIDFAQRVQPDVIVVEVAPLGPPRRELILGLRERLPRARIVVLTASADPDVTLEAARLGVDGWVSKATTVDELLDVMRAAYRGHACYPPEQLGPVLAGLLDDVRRARTKPAPLDALTDREHDVLAAMVEGEAPADIARRLCLSANTVRSRISRIYDKLGVHSRLEAVAVARSSGIALGRGAMPLSS